MLTMKILPIVQTLSIAASALIGDCIVSNSKFSDSSAFRAVSDSLVHATIGFLSSILFFSYGIRISNQAFVCNVMFCTLISSLIDVDHVFLARSFSWKALTTLKQRGIFHCTTFWLLLTSALFVYSVTAKKLNIYLLNWMLIIAFTSHHIRDANRRGLWLYPFGHTPALSKSLYVFLVAVLPNIFYYLYKSMEESTFKYTVIHYSNV